MNTRHIDRILRGDYFTQPVYIGCFPSDWVPTKRMRVPLAFVANTDDSQGSGKHWCAFYVDRNRRGMFFDSFGDPPTSYSASFNKFFEENCAEWRWNKLPLQHVLSTSCGYYACYALLMRARGLGLEEILEPFSKHNPAYNDELVHESICSTFDVHVPMYSESFIVEQFSQSLSQQRSMGNL
jgi:hypothetical protein